MNCHHDLDLPRQPIGTVVPPKSSSAIRSPLEPTQHIETMPRKTTSRLPRSDPPDRPLAAESVSTFFDPSPRRGGRPRVAWAATSLSPEFREEPKKKGIRGERGAFLAAERFARSDLAPMRHHARAVHQTKGSAAMPRGRPIRSLNRTALHRQQSVEKRSIPAQRLA